MSSQVFEREIALLLYCITKDPFQWSFSYNYAISSQNKTVVLKDMVSAWAVGVY